MTCRSQQELEFFSP